MSEHYCNEFAAAFPSSTFAGRQAGLRTYHAPPERVGVALEVGLAVVGSHRVLLGEVHEVTGEYEAEEADVERRDQLLKMRNNWI